MPEIAPLRLRVREFRETDPGRSWRLLAITLALLAGAWTFVFIADLPLRGSPLRGAAFGRSALGLSVRAAVVAAAAAARADGRRAAVATVIRAFSLLVFDEQAGRMVAAGELR